MSEFDHKPASKDSKPQENPSREAQKPQQDTQRQPGEQQSQAAAKGQSRDIYSMSQGDAGIGQGGGGGEQLSHPDLIPMPGRPSVANALARDTVDNQLFATGVRRVTPMEITVGGQQFTGSVSHDRDGNRFITDGRHTYRIFPGDATNPHGFIQLNRDTSPIAIQGQRVAAAQGESLFQKQVALKLPENAAALRAQENPIKEASRPGGAHNVGEAKVALGAFAIPADFGAWPHGKNLAHLFKDLQNQTTKDGRPSLDLALAAQFSNPRTRDSFAEFLTAFKDGKIAFDSNTQQGRVLQEFGKFLGPDGLTQLRQLLVETQGTAFPRLDTKFDRTSQGLIRDFVDLMAPFMRRPDGAAMNDNANASPMAKLLEIFKHSESPSGVHDGSRESWRELGKSVRDFNTMMGLDGAQGAIQVKELLGRSLDGGNQFTGVRGDEAVIAALLGRLGQARNEARVEAQVRTDAIRQEQQQNNADDALRGIMNRELGLRQNTNPSDSGPSTLDNGSALPNERQQNVDSIRTQQEMLEEQRRLEEEKAKKRKQEETSALDSELDMTALALAQAKRREQEKQDEQKKKEDEAAANKDKKDQDKRQKYVVREGDTLENIASRLLRDSRLAGLVYELNSDVIPTVERAGKKYVELRPKLIISLPNSVDVRDYRARMVNGSSPLDVELAQEAPQFESAEAELEARFGKSWSNPPSATADSKQQPGEAIEDMESAARSAYQARRKHIESLLGPLAPTKAGTPAGNPKCTVRLGDSLKSIAIKNPLLNDVTLWKLLAEMNNLSTETDEKGHPKAVLKRGQELLLPSPEQIEEYRKRGGRQEHLAAGRQGPQIKGTEAHQPPLFQSQAPDAVSQSQPGREPPEASAKAIRTGRMNTADWFSAGGDRDESLTRSILEATGFSQRVSGMQNEQASAQDDSHTRITMDNHNSDWTAPLPEKEGGRYSVIQDFSESIRLLQSGGAEQIDQGVKLRLELRTEERWLPVIVYEIYEDICVRHELRPDGFKKSLRIDLPPQSSMELAYNDLSANWLNYCDRFMSAKPE